MSGPFPGAIPQGFSFMAILELSAGASLAPRLWWAERALGLALIGVGLASAPPAYADQTLLVADNGTVHCEASAKDLTRISLKDDQFASVSKVQAANPADDFQVVNEPLRGDIYLSVANGFSKPTISFFGTTRKGFVYKFICAVGGTDARQVFIANADVERPRSIGEAWPAGLSPQDASARLIAAMYAQKPVEGFDITWRTLVPVNIDTLSVQMVGQYVGASYTGKLLKITNRSAKPLVLTEDKVAPADAIAVSITNPRLAPGEETTAFIVQRSGQAGEHP
ncbi:type-F conjugative transfer system secretin TraK [Novosphingobium sp. NBM11]|uniref:type-F conjugative transfer system secretin TraK n=1 Tax=Novosphingobium sp. NBM11 TaxID=2596914 RepID=UPI0018924228|nr:type-F conjugative transfer system secretin TraK [Novosphingobium sp. NBM11]MBF5091022.1 type-F conjugative transfer system secretin TraK [Novosphingobium sp. NBM11]